MAFFIHLVVFAFVFKYVFKKIITRKVVKKLKKNRNFKAKLMNLFNNIKSKANNQKNKIKEKAGEIKNNIDKKKNEENTDDLLEENQEVFNQELKADVNEAVEQEKEEKESKEKKNTVTKEQLEAAIKADYDRFLKLKRGPIKPFTEKEIDDISKGEEEANNNLQNDLKSIFDEDAQAQADVLKDIENFKASHKKSTLSINPNGVYRLTGKSIIQDFKETKVEEKVNLKKVTR